MTTEIDQIFLSVFYNLEFNNLSIKLKSYVLSFLPVNEIILFTTTAKKYYEKLTNIFKKHIHPHTKTILKKLKINQNFQKYDSKIIYNYVKKVLCRNAYQLPDFNKSIVIWYEKYSDYKSPNTPLLVMLCNSRTKVLKDLCRSISWERGISLLSEPKDSCFVQEIMETPDKIFKFTDNFIIPICVAAHLTRHHNMLFALKIISLNLHANGCLINGKCKRCIICCPQHNKISERGINFINHYCL